MEQRLSLVTLVVDDVARSRDFYVRGLGWAPEFDGGDEVLMIRVGAHTMLSLWGRAHAGAELGAIAQFDRNQIPPFVLAHNVHTEEEVDEVLRTATQAGSGWVQSAVRRAWGGYSGYFADPDGFRWEVAVNPTELGESLVP